MICVFLYCSFSSSGLKTAGYLEWIINPPLETGEGTDHDNSCSKSIPETSETDFTVDILNLLTYWGIWWFFVKDWDHNISGVWDDSAEDTSPVTWEESDHKLEVLWVGVLGVCENVFVESFNGIFKGSELNHSVWDLSHPEGWKTLVESVPSFVGLDGAETSGQASGEGAWVGSLHSDFKLKT